MSKGKILLGVLAGAAVGTLLGVLIAPDKGTETRRKITKKGEDYKDALEDKFDELMDHMTDKFDKVEKEYKAMVQNGKVRVDEFKRDAKNMMS
jgi:gas vesicle protein